MHVRPFRKSFNELCTDHGRFCLPSVFQVNFGRLLLLRRVSSCQIVAIYSSLTNSLFSMGDAHHVLKE